MACASVPEAKARLRAVEPRRYVVYVAFLRVFVFLAVTLRDDGFLSQTNLLNIVRQTTPVTVMAVAVVFVPAPVRSTSRLERSSPSPR